MLDSVDHVQHLASLAATEGVVLPVCIDIDLSLDVPGLHFGVWRSPLRSVEDVAVVVEAIARRTSLRLEGVMGYEAQIAGVGDNVPRQTAKNMVIRLLKRLSIRDIASRRAAVVAAIAQRGISLRFVNGGGTGSLETTAHESAVTEVTAGSGFFAPTLFDYYAGFRHEPAAGFALEIVRQPAPHIYTCLGGGYVASGSAGWEKLPAPYLPHGAALLPLEGAGEVQTPVQYSGSERLELGDPIFFRHSKAGELCERFTHLHLVAGDTMLECVPTYRGEGHAFL
jgi:D-serine deaminase-like pyridoxal phosphate-dependent protein